MKVIHCGDSFTLGVGCDKPEHSYAAQFSHHLGAPFVNLAKTGASSYVIYLQVMQAIQQQASFVLINTTTPWRTEWIKEGHNPPQLSLFDVNYHEYNGDVGSPIQQDPRYNPILFSETITGLHEFKEGRTNNYARLKAEPLGKIQTIIDYFGSIQADPILEAQCSAMINLGCSALQRHGIPFVVLANRWCASLAAVLDPANFLAVDFIEVSHRWPDPYGTLHTSSHGHKVVFDQLAQHYHEHF